MSMWHGVCMVCRSSKKQCQTGRLLSAQFVQAIELVTSSKPFAASCSICFLAVQACDGFCNPRRSGQESLAVEMPGLPRKGVCITDRQDGTYLVEYCVPAEGHYQAHVTLNGDHVRGSPAAITAFR